jgi:hypothetical protein
MLVETLTALHPQRGACVAAAQGDKHRKKWILSLSLS